MSIFVDANNALARDLVFRVKLDSTASVHLDAVTEWLTTAVGTMYPVVGCGSSTYPCALVSGTLHNGAAADVGGVTRAVTLGWYVRVWAAGVPHKSVCMPCWLSM